MRRFLVALALTLVPATAAAQRITVNDILELSKAGLGEEALLALIEVNRTVFPVDLDTLKSLKDGGVAPNVIVAMIKSGRNPPPPVPEPLPPPPAPTPQVVVVEHEHHQEPRVHEVAVPVPVYIPVRIHSRIDDDHRSLQPSTRPEHKRVEPVFWGWGGKLRPDAWKLDVRDVQKDAKIPREPQRK